MTLAIPIRYLIGADSGQVVPVESHLTVYPYDTRGVRAKPGYKTALYCNLLDEEWDDGIFGPRRRYGPYSKDQSGTPEEWSERRIDTTGAGWTRYLNDQFERATSMGFDTVELDNADSYHLAEVLDAINRAKSYRLSVLAKNPLECEGTVTYLRHPSIVGAIVEYGCGSCQNNDDQRVRAGKPDLPFWFVSNRPSPEKDWAYRRVREIKSHNFFYFGVTWCASPLDYATSTDLFIPVSHQQPKGE